MNLQNKEEEEMKIYDVYINFSKNFGYCSKYKMVKKISSFEKEINKKVLKIIEKSQFLEILSEDKRKILANIDYIESVEIYEIKEGEKNEN